MGYTTVFKGKLNFDRVLTEEEVNYINKISQTRRMKRDVSKLYKLYNGEGGNPFLPKDQTYGNEGEYFVGGPGDFGQDKDDSIINYNEPPGIVLKSNDGKRCTKQMEDGLCQPGLWCQWIIEKEQRCDSDTDTNASKSVLVWDGADKFYNYVEWLKYLINHFFQKWNVKLNGEITWEGEAGEAGEAGEESEDIGKIVVVDNVVTVRQ
jgi:hypothetical protein